MVKKGKKKVNPWADWNEYEEKNFISLVLQDISDIGYDEAIKKHKIEPWFEPKLLEHIKRVEEGESVQDL